jgi:deoxyribodipyrimidine photo-lyase
MTRANIVWFRQDLRLADQAAVAAATREGPWIGLYVLDDKRAGQWALGGAQRWWLHHSLTALGQAISARGGRLVLRRGDEVAEIVSLARDIDARQVFATRHYEPWYQRSEAELGEQIDLQLYDGGRLAPPGSVLTGTHGRFKIFTPYLRALKQQMPPATPQPAPAHIAAPHIAIEGDDIADWMLLPTMPDWAGGFALWTPGEVGAHEALSDFLPKIEDYDIDRNMPSIEGTSRLSPHLHFGEISPAYLWHRAAKHSRARAEPWLRELAWRDYAANVIDVLPHYGERSGRESWDDFHWRTGHTADADFAAWTKGLTGYPIVDAGMRELWTTGFIHNRVRMIVASFLIKHLLIDWRRGERWFWDTLVDADYGNNSVNWQWIAGTGIDSNPFGRIMAPLVQSPKFDAGDYIREWVPELRDVEGDAIHDPHGAGIDCPTYPVQRIGHREARERALSASKRI